MMSSAQPDIRSGVNVIKLFFFVANDEAK
jgi:hypothetical protein